MPSPMSANLNCTIPFKSLKKNRKNINNFKENRFVNHTIIFVILFIRYIFLIGISNRLFNIFELDRNNLPIFKYLFISYCIILIIFVKFL